MSIDNDRIGLYQAFIDGWESETTQYRFDTIQTNDQITLGVLPWIRIYISQGKTEQRNMGANSVLFRTIGSLLVFQIYARTEDGPADMYRIMDKIKLLFLGKTFNNGNIKIVGMSVHDRQDYNGWASKSIHFGFMSDEFIERT